MGHFAPTVGRERARRCVRRELSKEPREIGGGADEAAGRSERMHFVVARNDEPLAEQYLACVAARERNGLRQGHVGLGFGQPERGHDLAPDPPLIRLAGKRFDSQSEQCKAVIGIFKPCVTVDHRRSREIRQHLILIRERPQARILIAGAPVPRQPGSVRH